MKKASRIILLLAIAFVGYGYWGAFTQSGNRVYDEMDAMLPFFIFIAGAVLFIVFLVLLVLLKRKSGTGKRDKPGA